MKRFSSIVAVERSMAEQVQLHLGKRWSIDWGSKNLYSAFGYCSYSKKHIIISKEIVQLNMHQPWEIVDVILHEIAHGICRERHGSDCDTHGTKWKAICVEIGAVPARCYGSNVINRQNIDGAYRMALVRKRSQKVISIYKRNVWEWGKASKTMWIWETGKWKEVSKKSLEVKSIRPTMSHKIADIILR